MVFTKQFFFKKILKKLSADDKKACKITKHVKSSLFEACARYIVYQALTCTSHTKDWDAGPHSAVGNVSGYRCVSDCRSRGREFDPGPAPYFRGD